MLQLATNGAIRYIARNFLRSLSSQAVHAKGLSNPAKFEVGSGAGALLLNEDKALTPVVIVRELDRFIVVRT